MRPLRRWPTWLLWFALETPLYCWLATDIYIELWERDVVEPARAATDPVRGPWMCAPVRGTN